LYLTNVTNLSKDDYLKINNEILQIEAVDTTNKSVLVSRAALGTRPDDHYNRKEVSLYQANYRFNDNYRIFGDSPNKPYFINYDEDIKQISVSYSYGVTNPTKILQSSSFYDNSVPAKLVTIKSVEPAKFKLEFSKDNLSLVTNPTINVQKYYRYKFDTSHFSMVGTFLDFSASANQNIFTQEKYTNNIPPGNANSFITIKFGFGPNIASNSFTKREPVNFDNYFYFIKASNEVDTENSYLKIIRTMSNNY
jgi:hypothetical protein